MRWILALLLCELTALGATSWYADNTASGANNGTSWTDAWTNLNNVVWGASGVSAGDTLFISGGSTSKTYTNYNWTVNVGGSSGSPVTIRVGQDVGHNGKVIFDGSVHGNTIATNIIKLGNPGEAKYFITIDGSVGGLTNLVFVNWVNTNVTGSPSAAAIPNCILDSGGRNITIHHCMFSNVNNGITMPTGYSNSIALCYFKIRGDAAIDLSGSTARPPDYWDTSTVASNTIIVLCNPDPAYGSADGVQNGDGVTIRGNIITVEWFDEPTSNQHNDGIQSYGDYVKVYGNEFINTYDAQCAPCKINAEDSIENLRVYNNIFRFTEDFDTNPQCLRSYNQWGLTYYQNYHILNNLFVDSTNGGMAQALYLADEIGASPGTNNILANNIFVNVGYDNVASGVMWQLDNTNHATGQSEWLITNNILWMPTITHGHVRFLGTNYTVPTWKSTYDSSTGTNLPAFVSYVVRSVNNDFHLLGSDTNARDRGLDFSSTFTTDFDGNTRSGTWDIGPFEYMADAPSISVHPASTNIYGGQSATFSVTASGSAPLVYTWKLDGTAIPGATNSSFTTNLVRMAANGGVYKVAITNAEGGVESSEATLGVSAFHETLYCPVEPWAVRSYPMISSNSILLVWPTNQYRTEVRIARRNYTNKPSAWNTWVWLWTNVNPDTVTTASDYLDSTVASGVHYEYTVAMLATNWVCTSTNDPRWGYQYVNTGIEVPLKDERGHVILLIESGIASSIVTELATFTNDLIGDGYKLHLHTVTASDITNAAITNAAWFTAVTNTKALVVADYATDPTADWNLFILGHVPLPYSGSNSPGSHVDNVGAHPTDWYYAITNEAVWTDTIINYVNTSNVYDNELHTSNLPGDGKFDTNYIPGTPHMRLGRVDLRNLPAFSKTEVQLLSQYLTRDHAWRHSQVTVRDRGAVSTNNRPEESHGIFSSIFGPGDNLDVSRFLTIATNASSNYLFLHSAGGGLYTWDEQSHNSTNHGYTTNYAQAGSLYGVFMKMHGSYYGDIDVAMHSNLIFAAPLCMEGLPLTAEYREYNMGYEPWAMNEPIGQSMLTLVANALQGAGKWYVQYADIYGGTNYQERIFRSYNYEHLLGDPTLRIRNVNPPTNVVASTNGSDIVLTWTASTDTNLQGYHVYRAPAANLNDFTRLTTPPTNSPYTNAGGASAAYTYMVRAVKLEAYPTRSFYNASQGIFATTEASPSTNVIQKASLSGSRIVPRGKVVFH